MNLRRRNTRHEAEELNITAFMNLMVILVPFLLITAVFSRIAILELNIPTGAGADNNNKKPKLQLQVVVRENLIDVRDGAVGLIKRFPLNGEATNWQPLSDLLVQLKTKFPDISNVTLLVEQDVPYQLLVRVMDRARTADVVQNASLETIELFPAISIGDAPALSAGNGTAKGGRK